MKIIVCLNKIEIGTVSIIYMYMWVALSLPAFAWFTQLRQAGMLELTLASWDGMVLGITQWNLTIRDFRNEDTPLVRTTLPVVLAT